MFDFCTSQGNIVVHILASVCEDDVIINLYGCSKTQIIHLLSFTKEIE